MDKNTVLIVEDEEASLTLYQRALEGQGYRVLSARTGVEALAVIERDNVDAMLLDVRMPDMHGLELLDELRSRKKTIPTILCTAMTKAGEAFEARSYGVKACLTKPVDLDNLRAKVAEVFSGTPAQAPADSEKPAQ